jgi:hypothetical protein
MGKATMFLAFIWLVVSIAGNVLAGNIAVATTVLTSAISSSVITIPVASTTGFADTGIIVIGDERIAYSTTTTTTFVGTAARPMVRGTGDTDAAAHSSGDRVRTIESAMMNQSMGYDLAVLSDFSGPMYFITAPVAIFSLIVSFFVLPIRFLGTDLEIISYIWAIVGLGMIVTLALSIVGGRRV